MSRKEMKPENVAIANALQLEAVRATPALSRHDKFEVAEGGQVFQEK